MKPQVTIVGILVGAWVSLAVESTSSLRISAIKLEPSRELRLLFPAETNQYYILYRGGSVINIRQAAGLVLPVDQLGQLRVTDLNPSSGYFRLRQVPVDQPLDMDQDGMDDVFELHHLGILNPLDPADAARDYDGDGYSNLTEYLAGSDITQPDYAATVYVVDVPEPGNGTQFTELTNALAYLETLLQPDESGRVIVATERSLAVPVLSLTTHLKMEVSPEFTGRATIAGPGGSPLVINTAGSLSIAGFTLVNAGGMVVNASRRLQLVQNRFPDQTTINWGSASGGFLAGSSSSGSISAASTEGESGLELLRNELGKFIKVNLYRDFGPEVSQVISMNTGSVISMAGNAKVGGKINVSLNPVKEITLALNLTGSAILSVEQHANLDRLYLESSVDGNPQLTFRQNLGAEFTADFKGVGTVYAGFESHQFKQSILNLGGENHILNSQDFQTEALVVNLTGRSLNMSAKNLVVVGTGATFNFNRPDATYLVDLGVFQNQGRTEIALAGDGTFKLSPDSSLRGSAAIRIPSGNAILDFTRARFEGGVDWQIGGAIVSFKLLLNDARIGKGCNITGPSIAGAILIDLSNLGLENGSWFLYQGAGEKSLDRVLQESPTVFLNRPLLQPPLETGIKLRNITMASASALTDYLEVNGCGIPVLVEGCTLSNRSAFCCLRLDTIDAPVTVRNNPLIEQGLWIKNVTQPVLIENNLLACQNYTALTLSDIQSAELKNNMVLGQGQSVGIAIYGAQSVVLSDHNDISANMAGIVANDIQNLVVRDCTLSGQGGIQFLSGNEGLISNTQISCPGEMALLVAEGKVIVSNSEITGNLAIILGVLGLQNNQLSGVDIADANPTGGLINDPVPQGANPEKISSAVDFDGDGCADYPPPQRDDDGQCNRPGFPPPR
jgi:hypothetical protein